MTRACDIAPAIREAFAIAASGRPGPVLVDITKDAQLGACEFDWEGAAPDLTQLARSGHSSGADPVALINAASRPLILAGHGIILGGAEGALQAFAEKTQIPVAMTLLGIGCFPASHPLNLGMMGMHGEAWVNTAIQESDLLIALGMRFDDRVTGNLKTYAPAAKKIHVDIDPAEFNKNVPVDAAISGDVGSALRSWLSQVTEGDRAPWLAHITDLKGDSAVQDAKTKLVDASGKVSDMRSAFKRSVRRDPKVALARRDMDDARVARVTSSALLDGAIEARDIALDYAYYLHFHDPYTYRYSPNYYDSSYYDYAGAGLGYGVTPNFINNPFNNHINNHRNHTRRF